MKISEDLKYLINRFYHKYPKEVEEYKKGYKKDMRFLAIFMIFASTFFLIIFLIMYFFLTERRFPQINGFWIAFLKLFFLTFSILGFFGPIHNRIVRGGYKEGKWFLKAVSGHCILSKINENNFIPNKRETPKKYRHPFPWNEVNSINIFKKYDPPSHSEDTGQYNHFLKIYFKNLETPKLIWIRSTLKDKGYDDYSVILMKKFCEFLITNDQ